MTQPCYASCFMYHASPLLIAPSEARLVTPAAPVYRVAVDIGGTFTDLVVLGDDGRVLVKKVASTVDDYARGIVDGLQALLGEHALAGTQVGEVVHGTT